MPKKARLVKPGEPSQRTHRGLEIPIPSEDAVERLFDAAARKTTEGKRKPRGKTRKG